MYSMPVLMKIFVIIVGEIFIVFTLVHLYKTRGMLVYGYSFKENVKLKDGVDKKEFMKSTRINEYLSIITGIMVVGFTFYDNAILMIITVVIVAIVVWEDKKLKGQIDKIAKKS